MLIPVLLLALGLLVYTWAGYPLLLGLFGGRSRAAAARSAPAEVSVILAAFNEASEIEARLANLVTVGASLPPGSRFRVLLGIDAATDRTAELARAFARRHSQVRVEEFRERRGKVSVLKDLVAVARRSGEASAPELPRLLVFTDANTRFHPDALERLLAPFADREVGGVCGRLRFVAPGTDLSVAAAVPAAAASPEAAYWDLETWLKERESALDSCLGANGAIYAIRAELFWDAIPSNTIVDDFVIGMKVREQGSRMRYEPLALAEEELPELESEWTRRVRIGAGDFQAVALCRRCLSPRYGWFAWMFWSHKLLRWLTPHLILIALAAAGLALLTTGSRAERGTAGPAYWLPRLTLLWGGAMVLAGGLGRVMRNRRGSLARLLQLADHFATMQAALFAGFLRFLRGNLAGHWSRTPRQ